MNILLASSYADRSTVWTSLHKQFQFGFVDRLEDAPSILQHSGPYDGAVLEPSLPSERESLHHALREIRGRGLRLAVVVVCDQPTPEDEATLLQLGADDVQARSVHPVVLRNRMMAMQRRSLGHTSATLRCGNLVLDQGRRSIEVDGRQVRVTPKEFDVLELLMLRRGAVVSKERVMTALYGDGEWPDEKLIHVFVSKLRRKLRTTSAADTIRTLWGVGYRLDETESGAVEADYMERRPDRRRFAAQSSTVPALKKVG